MFWLVMMTIQQLPDNDEICDEIDNDCDSDIDEESINALTYYLDNDSDGYGDSDSVQTSCDAPENHVENDLDCDDTTDTRSPVNAEICDGIDNDCNDVVDEQTGENLTVYYLDDDEDGYGDLNNTLPHAQPEGYVLNAEDCDDDDDDISLDADEVCGDATDNNCDSLIDDETSVDAVLYYEDGDGDGFGDNYPSSLLCSMEADLSLTIRTVMIMMMIYTRMPQRSATKNPMIVTKKSMKKLHKCSILIKMLMDLEIQR